VSVSYLANAYEASNLLKLHSCRHKCLSATTISHVHSYCNGAEEDFDFTDDAYSAICLPQYAAIQLALAINDMLGEDVINLLEIHNSKDRAFFSHSLHPVCGLRDGVPMQNITDKQDFQTGWVNPLAYTSLAKRTSTWPAPVTVGVSNDLDHLAWSGVRLPAVGKYRLCYCNGAANIDDADDLPCDEPSEFDTEVGLVYATNMVPHSRDVLGFGVPHVLHMEDISGIPNDITFGRCQQPKDKQETGFMCAASNHDWPDV